VPARLFCWVENLAPNASPRDIIGMQNSLRLLDSGGSGVWRKAAEAPEYVVGPASGDDYVRRMDDELWNGPRDRYPCTLPERPERTWAAWDLAVAFAVHVSTMRPGPARDRMERRCLDALEDAVRAGCPHPMADHPDFAAVAGNPRFLELVSA
jgi:hypothetical protein